MHVVLALILAILCTFGGRFSSQVVIGEYKDFANGVGSILGDANRNLSAEDVIFMTNSMDKTGAMMQGIVTADGSPVFVDEKSFLETEDVLSRMGPYLCLLPDSHPKEIADVAPLLGGILGGLIGHMLGEENFDRGSYSGRHPVDILSGLGTLAGSVGGMSGYAVSRGPFGIPNASQVIQRVPEFVDAIGNKKKILDGSFQPLTERKYDSLRYLIKSDLWRSLSKMGPFLKRSSSNFYGEATDRSQDFNAHFNWLPKSLAEAAGAVSTMAGVYSGFLGYILPRDSEHHVSDNAYEKLLEASSKVGGYAGVIGGMMGEVFANGAPSEGGKILHGWSVPKVSDEKDGENDDEHTSQMGIDSSKLLNLITLAIPGGGAARLKSESKKCFDYIAMGLKYLSKMHRFDEFLPGSLEFFGPYGEIDDKIDSLSLEQKLAHDRFDNSWKSSFIPLNLINRMVGDLSVIDKLHHEDDSVIDFVNNLAADSKTLQFFRGTGKYNDLSSDDRESISVKVLSKMKSDTVNGITAENIANILDFESTRLNPERLKIFLKLLSDTKMNEVVKAINSQKIFAHDTARIVAIDLVERFGDTAYASQLCSFANGITPHILKKITANTLFTETNIVTCMDARQKNITNPQKQALVQKAYENQPITLATVQNLKSFSAELDEDFWNNNLTKDNIETLVNGRHFSNMNYLQSKQQRRLMEIIETKLQISSSESKSTGYLKNVGDLICGISASRLEDLVPSGDLAEMRSNWSSKCLINKFEEKLLKSQNCLASELSCKRGSEPMKINRKSTFTNYNSTRDVVDGNLSSLTGVLPLDLAASLDGLKLSELESIPDGVLQNSINISSDNEKLSKWQKKVILDKILEAGHEVDSVKGLQDLGDLASAIDVDSVNVDHMDEVLNGRPNLIKAMSITQKSLLYSKLSNGKDSAKLLSTQTMLSPFIPLSTIKEVSQLEFDALSKMRWSRSQAIFLVQKYKNSKQRSSLYLPDIRTLGKLNMGLTCVDVRNFKFHALLEIAREIDGVLGNRIPSDLANCLATKITVCLKMRCQLNANFNEIVGNDIPGNILLFVPPDVIASVAYTSYCTSMIRRLGAANIDLIPRGTGDLVFEGVVRASHICFNRMGAKPPPSKDGSSDSTSNEKRISRKEVETLGKFACFLEDYNKTVDGKTMSLVSKMLPTCLHRINEKTKMDMREMFKNRIGQIVDEHPKLLPSLGPIFPLVDPEVIKSMSDDAVAEIVANVPPMNMLVRARRDIDGDERSSTLSFEENLNIKVSEAPKTFTAEYDPVDMRAFADAAFPKFKSHMSAVGNADSDDSDWNDQSISFYEMILRAGPAVIGFAVNDINSMSEVLIKDALFMLGRHSDWNTEQLNAFKTKVKEFYGEISSFSSKLLQELGHLALMFTKEDLKELSDVDLHAVESLSRLNWPTNEHRTNLLKRFLISQKKDSTDDLSGPDLVALGDLLCGLTLDEMTSLNDTSLKFSASHLGKLRCLDEDQLKKLKSKILIAVKENVSNPAVLNDIGIFAGLLEPNELKLISSQYASLMSPDALAVAPYENIKNAWNESHFAMLGAENGAIIVLRADIFKALNAKAQNAAFRSAFGSNAGMVASQIELMKRGKIALDAAYQMNQEKMLESISMLFNKLHFEEGGPPMFDGIGSIFGLENPEFFIKPPPPDFLEGLRKEDFAVAFDASFLEDTSIINFINDVSSSSTSILNVMKGEMELNDLGMAEIQFMPPRIFQGLKPAQIEGMNSDTIVSLLDSDRAAQDPFNMFNVLQKMSDESFDSAIQEMNAKMEETLNSFIPWRPPLSTQEIVIKDFMKDIKKDDLTDTQKLDKFVDSMCPFVAGMPPGAIKKLPMVEAKKKEVLNCMSKSYLDLSITQKKQVIHWATRGEKGSMNIADLGQFMLDLPISKVKQNLNGDSALKIVNDGIFLTLDNLHTNYFSFSKQLIRKIMNTNMQSFDNIQFLDKLGHAQCEIPLKKLKKDNAMSKDSISHLAFYTMSYCKSKDELREQNLEKCSDDVALRLQRCQLLKQEANEFSGFGGGFGGGFSFGGFDLQPFKPTRLGLDTFKMVTELADTLFEEVNFQEISVDQIQKACGALGGLSPFNLDAMPPASIFGALDTIKNNSNLSPKQKSIMLDKVKIGGFNFDSPDSLSNLGELITEVSPEDFIKITPDNLRKNLKSLTRKGDMFSPCQRKAIMSKLQLETDIEDVLTDDLGSLASEIPLSKLDTLENINLTHVKDQKWDRPQAVKIVEKYKNSSEDSEIDAEMVSELGSTALGLKCEDIMDLQYYDVNEAATTIDLYADMPPDMDECMQAKLHFSNQVEHGTNYMNGSANDTEAILESIPKDVAMFYSPKLLNDTPDDLCEIIYEKVGQANLNTLPQGSGDAKRIKLAQGAIDCIKRTPDREFTSLEEEDILLISNLICDIPASEYKNMSKEGFVLALDFMKKCLHRLTSDHVTEIQTLATTHFGDPTTWDDGDLSAMGGIFSMFSEETISSIDNEYFADAYDTIFPPELSDEVDAKELVKEDAFYAKAKEALVESNQDETAKKKRTTVTPTYKDIASLGKGNTKWTVEELKRISAEDLQSSLDILGSVDGWSDDQRSTLLELYENTGLSRTIDKWTAAEVKDAKHILKDLTNSQITSLNISTLDTTTSLSGVGWSESQRTQAVERYMSLTSKTSATLTAEDVAGLGNLFCGLTAAKLESLTDDVVSSAMKDMGKLVCYNQDQLDKLYGLAKPSDESAPDAALIGQMGTIAAGMGVEDLKAVTTAQMPAFTESAITMLNGQRARDSFTNTQLAAAGTTNVAAMIRTKALFDALTAEQRNTLRTTAYGDDAELEDDDSTTTNAAGDGGASSIQPNQAGDATTTAAKTDGSGSPPLTSYYKYLLLFLFVFYLY